MVLLYILGFVIVLAIANVIAKKFADIAEMKGHEGRAYFWYTFLLGVVGMLMVIALPDNCTSLERKKVEKKSSTTVPATETAYKKTTATGDYKICSKCGMKLNRADKKCWSCGQSPD